MALQSNTNTYTSFAGADIIASIGQRVIGELQAITYSITREVAPIYVMGFPDPVSFSRGKRGIAGSLVLSVFDRDAMMESIFKPEDGDTGAYFDKYGGKSPVSVDASGNLLAIPVNETSENDYKSVHANYADQIWPFDVTISFQNEMGQTAAMAIYGIQLMNEGTSFSVDDITTEKAYTFVARRVEHMKPGSRTTGSGVNNSGIPKISKPRSS